MAIACAYCGGAHAAPAQVRECWARAQGVEAATPAPPSDVVSPQLTPHIEVATVPRAAHGVAVGAGPDCLARGVVIGAEGAVPAPWANAERVVIDAATLAQPAAAVAQLTAAAHAGRRVVAELLVPFQQAPTETSTTPPYQLGAEFVFALDLLHHLVWANAVDATGAVPRWAVFDDAVRLGATPLADGSGDVRLPDGTAMWLDGGPLRRVPPVDGVMVLPAVTIEQGSLRVPTGEFDPAGLADDQAAAVAHVGGATRVIAPAGSGKTRVLTQRARHLLRDWNLPASAVGLVAFNKRAQEEMQSRAGDLRGLRVRTLNAIALAIVNGTAPFHAQPRVLRTIDEPDVRRIIGRLVQFPRKRNTDPIASWIEALSVIRLGLQDPATVEAMYNGDVDGLVEMWPRYRAALDREGTLDFDDQVYRAIELLLADPVARRVAQRACRVLLVDEFQDLTPAHVLLVRLLSAPDFAVFGVGDDDQTIYGYSGADPKWLIEFSRLFPNAGMHPLEVNYRCPDDVVQAAGRLVRYNHHRVGKRIRAARAGTHGLVVDTAADTLAATLAAVTDWLADGRSADEVAVLTRVNALLAPVQVGLLAARVPVRGGVGREFTDRTAVRAVLAWLRLAQADETDLAPDDLAEALRRPSRPLHPNVATWVGEQQSLAGLRRLAARLNTERDQERVNAFADDIARLQRLARRGTTVDLVRALRVDIGLGASIATLDESRRGMNRAAQNDDLVALAQLAALQPAVSEFESWLRQHLATPWSDHGVTLATVHRVKGQEWPLVVLHHAQADQYPHRLAEDHEEERRVFHVAITRCSERVVVAAGDDPSPFVAELTTEPPPPGTLPTAPTRQRSPAAAAAKSTDALFARGVVLAAPGTVLIDGGQEWRVEAVDEAGVQCRLGVVTRRFTFGTTVVTLGRQRGALRPVPAGRVVADSSIRAHDLLRQRREQLRNGKPAYVVFDDATLERIAIALPTTSAELVRVPGIGPAKLEQYGDAIVTVIEDALGEPG